MIDAFAKQHELTGLKQGMTDRFGVRLAADWYEEGDASSDSEGPVKMMTEIMMKEDQMCDSLDDDLSGSSDAEEMRAVLQALQE